MITEEIRFLKAAGAKVDGLLPRVHEIVANNGQVIIFRKHLTRGDA
jgi:hypothetical protein